MSIDHTYKIGSDDSSNVVLNVSGLNKGGHDVGQVEASLYAYDAINGSAKFTCNLSLDDLRGLYLHLGKYSMIKNTQANETGRFVEVSGNTEELLSLLGAANASSLIPALKNFVANRLSGDDVNTILGRKDALELYRRMLDNADDYTEPQWQSFFERNDWIFGYGLKYKFLRILQREAHISGTDLDGSNAVISDFLLTDARFTKLVELKTPKTKLFENRQNRSDSWRLSTDLTDAISQILAQKANWELEGANTNYTSNGERINESAHDVECILVIGQFSSIEANDRERAIKLKTLELYRRNLRNIEMLLFDELYERARFIVEGSSG
ncbi:MAG: Shedu immune nuclease family protein [Phycisphaerae bacterium]|jgi:hypothetical protein